MNWIVYFFAFFAVASGDLSRFQFPSSDYFTATNLKPIGEELFSVQDLDIQTVVRDDDGRAVYNFTSFPRLENIFEYMDYLRAKYVNHVYVFDIGSSSEGLPLRVIRIGPPYLPTSTVWLDAGIHAREWISVSSLGVLMHLLAEHRDRLGPNLRNTEFFLLPVVNPDGFRYSYTRNRLWRKNRRFTGKCYGVDLNRNFPYMWGSTHFLIKDGNLQQKKPCNEIYEGPIALSEAESRALVYFILGSGRKFQAFLTFHSFGRKINYPYGYEPRVPKTSRLLHYVATKAQYAIANATGIKYDVSPLSMTEYVSPGNSIDWAYHSNITFSYLIELSDKSFLNHVSDILPTGKEAFIILQTLQWEQREKQLLEENRQLKKNASSSVVSPKEFENFQSKIESANETINYLKANLSKVNEEWRKKEMRLMHECDQLRHQLKSSPKFAQPDVERLQEQLKDTQEMNVKLKMDFESYKDKCTALENLCADLKKVIMDEQIAEKLYADDDTPASVKHFLASSPTSVLNTLTHMFGCLSRSARNRPYCGQKDKNDLFTTHGSSMMHDLAKSHEHHDLIRELLKEKEQLRKENVDLNRQVKELETIVRRRAHPNFSNVSEIIKSGESKIYEKESETIKNLKKELLDKQQVIIGLKNQMIESKVVSDQNLLSLQTKIVRIQEESAKMKEELEKNSVKKVVTTATANGHAPKCKRKLRSCEPPAHSAARNIRVELSAKEREVVALNKQVDELKRTNRKLMKDREIHLLSSKEQSAENIQLNNKFAKVSDESKKTSSKPPSPKRNVDIENLNLTSSEHEEIGHVDKKSPETATLNSSVDVLQTSKGESKSQNLQQVLSDLFKLLAKEESDEKIKNSNNDTVQSEEVRRFVAALKNFSN